MALAITHSRFFDRYFWGTLWVLFNIGLFIIAFLTELNRKDNLGNKEIFGITLMIARGSARPLNFSLAMILIPVSRNFLTLAHRIPYLHRILPFDKHLRFHKVIAYTMAFFTVIHTVAHYVNFRNLDLKTRRTDAPITGMDVNWETWGGVTGTVMVTVLALMISSAMPAIRQKSFEMFWYTHHLWTVFFFSALMHTYSCVLKSDKGKCYDKSTWEYCLLGLTIYAVELGLRYYRGFFQTAVIQKVIRCPSNVIGLQFLKPSMRMTPGQYVFINVPEISATQWHPFTLSSCPEEGFFSVNIRVCGDWTEDLAKRLGCMSEDGTWLEDSGDMVPARSLPKIRVDGPFGTPTTSVFKHEVAVLVGGGIGITPFASILKHIWYCHTSNRAQLLKLKRVYLVWIARDASSFEWFQDVLKHMELSNADRFLRIQIFLTGKLTRDKMMNVMVNGASGQAAGVDTVTGLSSRTQYGRPNMDLLFQQIHNETVQSMGHEQETPNVGVFYCGPGALGRQIRLHAHKHTSEQVHFQFRKEVF